MLRRSPDCHPGESRDPRPSRSCSRPAYPGLRRDDVFGLRCLARWAALLVALTTLPAHAGGDRPRLAAQHAEAGAEHPSSLADLDRLARARARDGELGDAAALRRRALRIAVATFGCQSPRAAEAMAALAAVQLDRRRFLDAEPLLIAAERTLREQGPDDPLLAAVRAGLARIAVAQGDTGAASAWAARAAEAARRNPDAASAEPLRALGAALAAAKRHDEAERALTEALAEDRRRHGPDDPETARSLAQLANLYLRWDRPGDALPLIQQALAIDRRRLGAGHPFIADALHDLGLVYEGLRRDDDARRAFNAALAVLERGAGRETPRVAYLQLELSRLDRRAGNDGAAEAAFRDARRILGKAEAEERRRERRT